MLEARQLGWIVLLLAASCVTESIYQKEVKKADDLKGQNETYAMLNAALKTEVASDVVRYLVSKGVDPNALSAAGFGETRPVASNDTAAGKAKNRRIEIVLK